MSLVRDLLLLQIPTFSAVLVSLTVHCSCKVISFGDHPTAFMDYRTFQTPQESSLSVLYWDLPITALREKLP